MRKPVQVQLSTCTAQCSCNQDQVQFNPVHEQLSRGATQVTCNKVQVQPSVCTAQYRCNQGQVQPRASIAQCSCNPMQVQPSATATHCRCNQVQVNLLHNRLISRSYVYSGVNRFCHWGTSNVVLSRLLHWRKLLFSLVICNVPDILCQHHTIHQFGCLQMHVNFALSALHIYTYYTL